uniref:Serine proteinase n=1 Tax=Meloidogyne incognita TaxID=6306 RepID=B4X6X3_MELIC|nr:serine proteinase [Meloidogyne incognita]
MKVKFVSLLLILFLCSLSGVVCEKNIKDEAIFSSCLKQCGVAPELFTKSTVSFRAYGGTPTNINLTPFVALLVGTVSECQINTKCTAVIISKNFLLSAAHCIQYAIKPDNNCFIGPEEGELVDFRPNEITIFTGISNLDNASTGHASQVKKISRLSRYYKTKNNSNNTRSFSDLALIELYNELNISLNTRPICIPNNFNETFGNPVYFSGFGKSRSLLNDRPPAVGDKLHFSGQLHTVQLSFSSPELCHTLGTPSNENYDICAGRKDAGISKGDSGGPLVHYENSRAFLVGIYYTASAPADKNLTQQALNKDEYPDSFVRVSRHCQWLKDVSKVECIPFGLQLPEECRERALRILKSNKNKHGHKIDVGASLTNEKTQVLEEDKSIFQRNLNLFG